MNDDIGIKLWYPVTRDIKPEFMRVLPWLQEALDYNGGEVKMKDVWDGLLSGEYYLLTSFDAAIVLQEVRHPNKSSINFFLAGGDMDNLRVMEEYVCHWAKELGYDSVTIFGRRGWLRHLDGYKEQAVFMEKKLRSDDDAAGN